MWKSKERIARLEKQIEKLQDERFQLQETVEDLKLKKKIEEEDIKHMVKIKEERLQIDHEKKVAETEKEKDREIAKIKDEYRDKIESGLEKQKSDVKEMYSEILARLPDINVKLQGNV